MTGFINQKQSPKERRIKYNFIRLLGYDYARAKIMRDRTVRQSKNLIKDTNSVVIKK